VVKTREAKVNGEFSNLVATLADAPRSDLKRCVMSKFLCGNLEGRASMGMVGPKRVSKESDEGLGW